MLVAMHLVKCNSSVYGSASSHELGTFCFAICCRAGIVLQNDIKVIEIC